MKATVHTFYGTESVTISIDHYRNNGNLAIQLWCDEGPFATLTVNLNKKCADNCAFVDDNNCPWAADFIEQYHLGKPTGKMEVSGWCFYFEYEFDLEEIKKYEND